MKVIEINLNELQSTAFFDPDSNRFDLRPTTVSDRIISYLVYLKNNGNFT
jgi:hypothetical protein